MHAFFGPSTTLPCASNGRSRIRTVLNSNVGGSISEFDRDRKLVGKCDRFRSGLDCSTSTAHGFALTYVWLIYMAVSVAAIPRAGS